MKDGRPLTIAYGGGTNSTAMLIGMRDRGIVPDLITFADTGGEKPETYRFVETFDRWLRDHDMPGIVTVRNDGQTPNLEHDCLNRNALPSLAYGWKSCSERYKQRPQNKYLEQWTPAIDCWEKGEKVLKAIGYDADEPHRAGFKVTSDGKYELWFPLIDWGWGRDECVAAIRKAGLPLPGKSACWFCPAAKKKEVLELAEKHPDLFKRAVEMERNADLTTVQGLGRHWSWESLVKADREQMKLFVETQDMPCMCFDGDD